MDEEGISAFNGVEESASREQLGLNSAGILPETYCRPSLNADASLHLTCQVDATCHVHFGEGCTGGAFGISTTD